MLPTLAGVVTHLARIVRATVGESGDGFVLSSAMLERQIILNYSVFAQVADRLSEIASDVFPRIEPERAIAMLMANYLDAVDASVDLGLPLVLSREGFVAQANAD